MTDSLIRIEPTLVKKAVTLALQQLGDKNRDAKVRQLALSLEMPDAVELDTTGVDLEYNERRALHAVLALFSETDYAGNSTHNGRPALHILPVDYYDAYGVTRRRSGAYETRRKREALAALLALSAKTHKVQYTRRRADGSKEPIVGDVRLLSVLRQYTDTNGDIGVALLENELNQPDKRLAGLIITYNDVVVEQLAGFHFYVRADLFSDIDDWSAARKGTRRGRKNTAIPSLIDYLLSVNNQTLKPTLSQLAQRLRVDHLAKSRHKSRMRATIDEALEYALARGYLLSVELATFNGREGYVLTLNPEKCSRVRRRLSHAKNNSKRRRRKGKS